MFNILYIKFCDEVNFCNLWRQELYIDNPCLQDLAIPPKPTAPINMFCVQPGSSWSGVHESSHNKAAVEGQAETHTRVEHPLSRSQHMKFPEWACPETNLGSYCVKCQERNSAHDVT